MNQPETKTAPKSAFTVKETCYAGLFAAVIAIMAQISIPMPGGVPMTMQTFVVALVAGTVLNYVVGVAMFCALTQSTLAAGITACVLPFIPTAIIKAILASVVGFAVRKRLN